MFGVSASYSLMSLVMMVMVWHWGLVLGSEGADTGW